MIDEFENAWMIYDLSGLKFDRNSAEKDKNIKEKYYKDLTHFFSHHDVIQRKILLEQFITIKVKNEYFQGYIDAMMKDDDGNYIILDWKTSSIYKGKKALKECGQLVLYALGLHQKGIPWDKIKICWNFLKYQNVTIYQKNGNTKVRQIERCKVGESLATNAKMWLKHFGYEDDMLEYLDILMMTNDVSGLPKEVQEKYHFEDCYVYVDLTKDLVESLIDDIVKTTKEIREKTKMKKYLSVEDGKDNFWDDVENIKNDNYYFSTLCGYSPKLHLPYAEFLKTLESKQGREKDKMYKQCVADEPKIDDDLSWLENLLIGVCKL